MPQVLCGVFALCVYVTLVFLVPANGALCWEQAKEQTTKPASSACAFEIYNDPVPSRAAGPARAKSSGAKKRKSAQAGSEQPGKSVAASGDQNSSSAAGTGEVGDGGWEVLQVQGSGATEAGGNESGSKADVSDESKISHAEEKKPTDEVATKPQALADESSHLNPEADAAKAEIVEAAKIDAPSTTAAEETVLEMEEVEVENEQPAAVQTVRASRLCLIFAVCLPVCLASAELSHVVELHERPECA